MPSSSQPPSGTDAPGTAAQGTEPAVPPPPAPRSWPLKVLHGVGGAFIALAAIGAVGLAFPSALRSARESWLDLTGTGPRGGLLFIEAPQVYTRERLVNDRFDQANWLNHELEVSERDSAAARLQAAARVLDLHSRIDISLASAAAPKAEAAAEDNKAALPDRVQLDQMVALDRRLEYRNKVRSELMDTLLDDSHDLDGNTLYRFNFDTVVMPWADVRRYPGTAVFLISARSTRPKKADGATNAEQLIETRDNLELLQSWQREIQSFLSRVVKYRIDYFYTQAPSENKSDPKEDIFFEFFLRKTLMDAFIDLLSANIAGHCKTLVSTCPYPWGVLPAANLSTTDRQLRGNTIRDRRIIISRLLQVNYSDSFGVNVEYPPLMELGFKNALVAAHKINTLQWPRLGETSYRSDCTRKYSQTQPSEEDIERDCLLPYVDRGYKRAIIRLIVAIEAMKTRLESLDRPLFEVGSLDLSPDRPPQWFTNMRRAFADLVPSQAEIDRLSQEIEAVQHDGRALPRLEQVEAKCETGPFRFNPRTFTRNDLIAYGKCRFLRSHAAKIDNLIARFIYQRVVGGQTMFGEMAVTNFVDVHKVGCDVTECRIEVRSKERPDIECSESTQSNPCNTINAQPDPADKAQAQLVRAVAECREIIQSRVTPTHATQSARQTYHFIGQQESVSLNANEKMIFSDCVTASELRNWLEETNVNVAVYEVGPHTGGPVMGRSADAAASGSLGLGQGALGGSITGSRQVRDQEVGVAPIVIGFGQLRPDSSGFSQEATFGWVIRPQKSVDGRWMPSHHRLSAIISVPSWWKRLKFTIKACWTTPEKARAIGFGILDDPESTCEIPGRPQAAGAALATGLAGNAPSPSGPGPGDKVMMREFIAQLPRRTEDVTERFRFDFIKAPYLDDQWLASTPQLRLEAGRPGKLVILGGRLWRGTVATVMGQPANKITVLPDMKGVIAEFDCVATPAELSGLQHPPSPSLPPRAAAGATTSGAPQSAPPVAAAGRAPEGGSKVTVQKLTVWTSEGRTQDMPVEVYPFDPAYGGRPCDAPLPTVSPSAGTPPAPPADTPKPPAPATRP